MSSLQDCGIKSSFENSHVSLLSPNAHTHTRNMSVKVPLCKSSVSNGTLRNFERRFFFTSTAVLDMSVFFFNTSPPPAAVVPTAVVEVVAIEVDGAAAVAVEEAAGAADEALVALCVVTTDESCGVKEHGCLDVWVFGHVGN